MPKSRALLVFENAIKSEATKRSYRIWLDKFKNDHHIEDHDSLLSIEPSKLQIMLEDYLFKLKKRYSPSSIKTVFFAIELFYSMNDVSLNFKKIRKMFPEPLKKAGSTPYTTEDIQKILSCAKSKKVRAIIHFLASSGVRIGAISDLKIRDLAEMEYGCKSVLVYAGSKDEYYTFITPEASNSLDEYLNERRSLGEKIHKDSPVFATFYNKVGTGIVTPLSFDAMRGLLTRAVKSADFDRFMESRGRFNIQLTHGYRKRFNTVLKSDNSINSNLVEKMMGHSTTIQLDNSYLKPTKEKIFAEYAKGIVELTISDEERQKLEIEKKQIKITELEMKNRENKKLIDDLDILKLKVERIEQSKEKTD